MNNRLVACVLTIVMIFSLSVAASAKTLNMGVGADVVRLDPPNQTDNVSETVLRHIMDGLVEFDEELNIKPALAESWEFIDDGMKIKFILRKGVKFHDGTPFNAEAVKFNFDRILAGGLKRTSLYEPYIESVTVTDEFTVVFNLTFPFGAFLHHLAHGAGLIQSPAAVEKFGDQVGRHPVGTGPFFLKQWIPGDKIILTANEDYWAGTPKIDGIVFKVIPEDATRVFQLEAGESDVIVRVPPTEVPRLESSSGTEVLIADSLRVIYLGMVSHKSPLDDVRVRRAINHAIDKDLICQAILGGFGSPADSPVANLTSGYYSAGGYEYNPEKAKQLLAEAGYPDGLTISLWTPKGRYLKDYETSLVAQQMLAEAGIKAELVTMEWSTYISSLFDVTKETAKAEVFLLGWAPSTGDADWVLRPLFSSELTPPTGDNATYYSNPAVDEAIQGAMRAADPAKRYEFYKNAQQLIHDDAAWAPLHVLKQVVGKRSNVKGVKILPIEIVLVKDAYFE